MQISHEFLFKKFKYLNIIQTLMFVFSKNCKKYKDWKKVFILHTPIERLLSLSNLIGFTDVLMYAKQERTIYIE